MVCVTKRGTEMSVLVLSEQDVRDVLDMESCVEAMTEVLSSLARGELFQPLRSVARPPADELFGLMPAWRGGDSPVFSLKEIVIAPGNAARGLDPHQGAVLLHDGTTGKLRAILNASAITEIRTAAVSAVATKALARPDAATVAILGSGVQGRSHVAAMRAVLPEAEVRIWSRTHEHAVGLALASHGVACSTVEEALAEADVVCTCTSSREPVVRREWLAAGAHVNAVGSSVPSARELDTVTVADASLFVDRRESTVNEAGDYLVPLEEGAITPDHIRAELGEVLIGAHPGRASDDELTLFKSLGLAVEDLAAAELCVARATERGLGVEVDF
jgi:ornithine cyclodeaminase/alanine dehydrogenase-like protein (mu-crystallin family)